MKDGREIAAILLEAKESGVQFSDWPKGEITVTKTEATADKAAVTTVKVSREATAVNGVVEPAPYTYPESEYEAYEFINGKKSPVGMRECCNTCRVSFVGHICETPTYLNNRKVFIVKKKG